jgi:hypothetical protein
MHGPAPGAKIGILAQINFGKTPAVVHSSGGI